MSLPPLVQDVATAYLRLVDDAAPGLVEGLYFDGSVALGDFRPDRSDIDFVALVRQPPTKAETGRLAGVHQELARLHPRPYFDGTYLTRADLAAGPEQCPDVPSCLEATFTPSGRQKLSPVTWHELAEHGKRLRGPDLAELGLWTDREALLDHTRTNLQTYWRGWIGALDRLPTKLPERAGDPWFVEWCALGVVRLHALLATGRLHSKGSAGRYALETFEPRWHPILTEALRIRTGDSGASTYDDPGQRLRDTRELVAAVVGWHG
ncbi:nucleotidyltransferase domain-containing protein [Flindersiella endophytica]